MKAPEFFNLGEVAATFGWTTRFVERLAATGKLPGVEVDGQWRFSREELIDWLDQKIQTLDADEVAGLEHKFEAELRSAARQVRIADRLRPELVALDPRLNGKPEVLKELVSLAEKTGALRDAPQLHASLLEREALCSTALPGGLAICHPRRPVPHLVSRTVLAVLRTAQAIAFGAEDGEPTRLFFLIAATDDRAHLYALARLVRVLRGSTLAALHRAQSADEVVDVIRRREAEMDAATAPPR